jgi:thiol:disulfide interchange protein DsbA
VKRFLTALLFSLVFAVPSRAEPIEDVDYVLIEPQAVATGGRIEIIEFFHYGCETCYRLEPLIEAWSRTLPGDVQFRRAPALRRMDWVPLTGLYYALQELDELDRLHGEVYRAVHEHGRNLGSIKEALAWGESHGLERARFEELLRSDAVAASVQRARDTTVAYGIRSTPSLVVDGRYLTGTAIVGSLEDLFPVLDGLIAMARAARGASQ